jgi:heme/copper-type cytochrome/quinol oxidase subunit 4
LSEEADMVSTDLPHLLVMVALAAVAIVLLLGLWNMMRGGSASRSQTLMRWRVILQFIAIILIMGTLWMMGR